LNIGFELIFPRVKLNKYQNDTEIDGVEFLRRHLSPEDFKRFSEIVREYFWEMGWGGNIADYYSSSPPDGGEPPKRKRRRKRKNRQREWRRPDA